jgi:lipoate-protein ligase A
MSLPIRPLDTGLMSARRNIAVTAVLAEMHRPGQTPHTFCRYPSSVLLGCCQRLADAIRMKACRSYRIEVARRVTVDGVSARICSGIAALLRALGCRRGFGRSTMLIGGSKIPGSSDLIEGSTMVFQGTVLIESTSILL